MVNKNNPLPSRVDPTRCVEDLIRKFVPLEEFGSIRAVDPTSVAEPFQSLLVHHSHMTVAMENFHGYPVSLQVVNAIADKVDDENFYTREIVLTSPYCESEKFSCSQWLHRDLKGSEHVVQYGIVKIAVDRLPEKLVALIQAGDTPLGRILIEAELHRDVRCVSFFELVPGPHFLEICPGFEQGALSRTYGRFATISISSKPVIDLFEVVIPSASQP